MTITGAAARRKGSTFERAVVDFLRLNGHRYAERAYGAGRPDDVGDIDGIPGWVIEAKNHKTLELARWADEAAREAVTGRCHWWAVIAKRRNRPVGDAYVIMPLSQFARLLADDESWDGIVRGPKGYQFFCQKCQTVQTVPHDTHACGPAAA